MEISLRVLVGEQRLCAPVEKAGELAIRVDESGYVTFSLSTSEGIFSVTSSALLEVGTWQRVVGIYLPGRLSIQLDNDIEIARATGTPIDGAAPVVIGEGMVGNVDEFKMAPFSGAGDAVILEGLRVDGSLQLDEHGEGSFTIRSTGEGSSGIERIWIGLSTSPSPTPTPVPEP
jgi:hypothetical protein